MSADKHQLRSEDVRVGRLYRGRRPHQNPFTQEWDDRIVLHVDRLGVNVQYDSTSVRNGRRYPSVAMEKFLRWASHEVCQRETDDKGDFVCHHCESVWTKPLDETGMAPGEVPHSQSRERVSGEQNLSDREMTEFLAGVVGVVEANSYEKLCLWEENHRRRAMPWVQRMDGLMVVVGNIDDRPVCITLTTADVGGHKILFIDPTSQVVDHAMIEKWLLDTLPASARQPNNANYLNKADAMNFHNVFPR